MKNKLKFQINSKRQIAFYIVLIAVIIAFGGDWYYGREKEQIIKQKEKTLTAIATLKAKQIAMWYKDELKDAQEISTNPYLEEVVKMFVRSNSPIDRTSLLELLKQIKHEHGSSEVLLTSLDGGIIASANSQITPIYPDELRSLNNITHNKGAISTSFFNSNHNADNQFYISFISTVNWEGNNLSYAIIVRQDAANDFLPLIESWPTESQTGESIIFCYESQSILLNNELKHQAEIWIKEKLPFSKDNLLSKIYTSRQPGIYFGKDYRNNDVLASMQAIDGTEWVLISKIDKSELLQEFNREALFIIILVLLLVALSSLLIVFLFNTRQKNIYKGLLEKERELWAQQEKFNVIMDSIGDGIITLDLNSNIQYINNRAEELTGWKLREALGRVFHEVYNVINEETGQQENDIINKVLNKRLVKELSNHTILISKNGKEIPVMDTGAPLFDESGKIIGIVISFQDETEKRTQSRLLKQSEEKYRILVKNIPQKVFVKNHELSYVYCNENFAEDLGITSDEIVGKSDYDFFSKEMADKYRNDDRFILEKEETITLEEEYQVKDISFWVKTTKTPIKDENGKIIGLLGIFEDITEKMRTQTALMKSEEKYRLIFENDITGNYHTTLDGKILTCNTAFVKMLKYKSKEEIYAINTSELYFGNSDRDKFINKIRTEKKLQNNELTLKAQDGSEVEIIENVVGVFDEAGELKEIIGYMSDITDKIRAEKELLKKDQLLSSVMETQQELIARYLPDTTLTFVNKAYCKFFGYSENELVGHKFLRFVPESEWNTELSRLGNLNKRNSSITSISQALNVDGSICSIEWTDVAIFNDRDEVIEIQSVGNDITEKLKAEQELIKAKEKAEESDKLKTAFINNISHEIRTPLNTILGFGHLLAEMELSPEEKKEMLAHVQESSDRLLNTVNDYVDIAMIVSGTMEVHKKEFQLYPFFDEIVEKTRHICAEKDLELETETPKESVELILDSDPKFILRTLNILLDNAVKFTDKGSIKCGYQVNNGFLEFFVQDSGLGISHDKLEMIFKKFAQEETSNTRGYEGSGLGLTIASGLVNLLGGTISATSEKGKGSIFTFTVPFNKS
ncbi:MAG: PAS domain S-box protein [Bacteroidales bacterium]|nr:PAS domain S-box protein [Bacteroidales bacterium]